MPAATSVRFTDSLPAVLRQDGERGLFLERFLRAFEELFAGIQQELDAIPDLFGLSPTPVLADAVAAGADTLRLDSAAGLCPGDVLLLDSPPSQVEFVEVKAAPAGLLPVIVTVGRSLRFAHARGKPVRPVGAPGLAATVRAPLGAGAVDLTVEEAPAWGLERGHALRIGDGARVEYVLVVSVGGATVTFTPALAHAHEPGRPVVFLRPPSLTTPPLAFPHAARTGPELLLSTGALAGERVLELDTVTGLGVGDLLHLRERAPERVEFARVAALPPDPALPAVLRSAVRLSQPLRSGHDVGVAVGVVGAAVTATRLAARAVAGATTLTVDDPEALSAAGGDVLQVDDGGTAEHVQVLAVSGQTVTVAPVLARVHEADRPVTRLGPSGSGTAFVSWLAGWIGLALRPDRGERWNRELLRRAGRLWPRRGTQAAVEAFLSSYLRGEARAVVHDHANPLQVGLISTVGVDTVICGGVPHSFWADLVTEPGHSRLYSAEGLSALLQAAHQALRREKPAHARCDIRLQANTMQIGIDPQTEVGARVGDTTLLWEGPLLSSGDP